MNKTKKPKYRPRTEAQKIARRERDRKRREELRRAKGKQKTKVAEKHPIVKKPVASCAIIATPIRKRLVKVTVIKEYVID